MNEYQGVNLKQRVLDYGTDEKAVFNFFNAVYAWMAVGLAVTGAVAFLVSRNVSVVLAMNARGITIALFLGLAVLAFGIRSAALRISAAAGTALFLLYAAVLGAALSYIFLIYRMDTIAGAFIVTGGTFAAMSIYGYVTKRDLTSLGGILTMVAIGLFLASLVNIFMASTALSWFITYAVVVVFVGLTAYDTQMLKNIAQQTSTNADLAARYAIIGSLMLYVDFINIFVSILRIMGNRR